MAAASGGNLRQAGVFAAAGLVGLTQMTDRLVEDHEKAKELAAELVVIGWRVEPAPIETNILFASSDAPNLDLTAFTAAVGAAGVQDQSSSRRAAPFRHPCGHHRREVATASRTIARIYREDELVGPSTKRREPKRATGSR